LLAVALLLQGSLTALSQDVIDHNDTSAPLTFVDKVKEQIPIWRADKSGQFENPELDLVEDDVKLWDNATDALTRDAIQEMLIEDWYKLVAVDEQLKNEKVI
jgi:hypothetical protein